MAAARVAFSSSGAFRQAHGRQHVVERPRVVVDRAQQRCLQGLRALGERRRGCPRGLVPGLADRQVRDHGRKRRAEAAGKRRHRAAARGRRIARDLVDEALDRHRNEGRGHPHSVLDDPLVGIEGRKLGEAQRLDGELHELALRQAGATAPACAGSNGRPRPGARAASGRRVRSRSRRRPSFAASSRVTSKTSCSGVVR